MGPVPGDAPALPEIEITSEMVEAALPFLYRYHPETGENEEETIRQILLAAFRAYPRSP